MTLYIVKFVPNVAGVMPTQGLFNGYKDAKKVYDAATKQLVGITTEPGGYLPFVFSDDWGFQYTVNLLVHTVLFMDLESSVKMSVHLQKETERYAKQYGAGPQPGGFITPTPGIVRAQ